MALDGDIGEITPEELEARQGLMDKLGDRCMGKHEVASVNNGFPPDTYGVITPESYSQALAMGEIAMETTNFSVLGAALEEIHGPPNYMSASRSFGDTVNPQAPEQKMTFDLNMDVTPS